MSSFDTCAQTYGTEVVSCRWLTALLYDYCKKRAVNPDVLINGQSRGFRPLANTAEFLQQFRQQPSNALLRLLARRWRQQITASPLKKIVIGRRLGKILGSGSRPHSYWLFPLRSPDPLGLIAHLRSRGFDATNTTPPNLL